MKYQYQYNNHLVNFSRANRKNFTDAEKLMWLKLRNNQLNGFKFRRQFPILNYILDFYCHKAKLAIELDGSFHLQNRQYDKTREKKLLEIGIKTLRFWDNDVIQKTDDVLGVILTNLNYLAKTKPHPARLITNEYSEHTLS